MSAADKQTDTQLFGREAAITRVMSNVSLSPEMMKWLPFWTAQAEIRARVFFFWTRHARNLCIAWTLQEKHICLMCPAFKKQNKKNTIHPDTRHAALVSLI